MSRTDHLALAKDYIARGDEFYAMAAEEISAAMDERPELTWAQVGRDLDRDPSWVRRLVTSFRNRAVAPDEPFKVDWQSGNYETPAAKRVLADPEQRKRVLASLPAEQVEEIIEEAHDVARERINARRAEQDTTPVARDLMGGERFDPSESWIDADLVRVRSAAHSLRRQVEKWGLVIGSMDEEQAFEYLREAERNVAEVRAALQERMADRARSEA